MLLKLMLSIIFAILFLQCPIHALRSDKFTSKFLFRVKSSRRDNFIPHTLHNFEISRLLFSVKGLVAASTVVCGARTALADEDAASSLAFFDEKASQQGAIDPKTASEFVDQIQKTRPLNSDEFVISFEKESIGLGLQENLYQGFPVVIVKSIKDASLANTHPELREGAIITAVGTDIVDGTYLKDIAEKIRAAPRPTMVRFRDPSRFFELLDSSVGKPLRTITTSYLPANARDAGAAEQLIYVQRLALPPPEERTRATQYLDVMEIQYVAQLPGSDAIVDSSAERSPPGASSQAIYYILGQQNGPPGKFPPGWDLTLRGMVRGETRRITLPYTLAYERKGSKDKKIPPFATVVYTVKLLSIT